MKAALLVESLTGNTWEAGELIADKLSEEHWTITGMSSVRQPDLGSLGAADVVLVGTWTHGLFVVGQAPWALGSIANLPTLRGKQIAGFLTYALNAGKAANQLNKAIGQTGGRSLGALTLRRDRLEEHTDVFIDRLLATVDTSEQAAATK